MTPKEKALEIIYKMFANWLQIPYEAVGYHLAIPGFTLGQEWDGTKHCALIAVEEILDEIQPFELGYEYDAKIKFWNNVKKEIEAL